jgi:hypothetical protein
VGLELGGAICCVGSGLIDATQFYVFSTGKSVKVQLRGVAYTTQKFRRFEKTLTRQSYYDLLIMSSEGKRELPFTVSSCKRLYGHHSDDELAQQYGSIAQLVFRSRGMDQVQVW